MNFSLKIFCLGILLLTSLNCNSIINNKTIDENLIGIWTFKNHENGETTYKKRFTFKWRQPGIEFKKNGQLVKKQNIGWCGTAPIKYDYYDGNWEITKDSLLTFKYDYWAGEAEVVWKILEVNNWKLKVKNISH